MTDRMAVTNISKSVAMSCVSVNFRMAFEHSSLSTMAANIANIRYLNKGASYK